MNSYNNNFNIIIINIKSLTVSSHHAHSPGGEGRAVRAA